VSGSTVTGNTGGTGGGIDSEYGPLTVTDSTVSGNSATGDGGGIWATRPIDGPKVTVTGSTVSGNTAGGSGGGISVSRTSLSLADSTVSGNTAGNRGGGILASSTGTSGPVTLAQATVVGNSAPSGGNIALVSGSGANYLATPLTLANSIVAGARAGGDVARFGPLTSVTVLGANIVQDGSVTGPGVLNVDPLLGPLADNAGPTKTHAPLPGSPAIDAGDTAQLPAVSVTDQRGPGFSRVRGAAVDLGAVETQPPPGPVSVTATTSLGREGDPAANALVFTIHRAGDPSAPLDVPAAFAGTATAADYTVSVAGGTQTPTGFRFAAGSTELTVTLSIVDDLIAESVESVILSVGPGPGFPADSAVAVIDGDLDLVVDSTADAGSGSLRLALEHAEERPGPDVVSFDPVVFSTPRTINLTTGGLDIQTDITLVGPGANLLTVRQGDPTSRTWADSVFNIGTLSDLLNVRIEGMTITGGQDFWGGGVSNLGESVVLAGVVVTGNSTGTRSLDVGGTGGGGGVANIGGTLTVIDSTISGNSSSRSGGGGVANRSGTMTLDNTTVSGNTASSDGGGVANHGTLSLLNTTVSGNVSSRSGGGVANTAASSGYFTFRPGTVSITNSTVSGNRAGRDGGGVASQGPLTLTGSTVSGNTAGHNGGGVASYGTLTLTNSTVSGNAAGRDGGGVANGRAGRGFFFSGDYFYEYGPTSGTASATLANTTVTGNRAGHDGGGVANNQATLGLVNSTVSGNTAGHDGGGLSNRGYYQPKYTYYYNGHTYSYGGSSVPGRATLTQVTIAGNAAPAGGNIANGDAGELTLANSIVADAASGGDVSQSGHDEELVLSGVNLVEDGSVSGPGVINADPKLGPHADNGGPTETMALLPGSPAFNAGSAAAIPAGLTTDQRGTGFDRVRGGGVDLGAFEVQTSRITAATDTPSTPEDTAVTVAVLDNDADEYGTPLHVTAVGTPSSGTVVLNPDATITYTPAANFNGTATFTYTVTNAFGDSRTGTVEVTVTAVNDAPTVSVPAAQTTAEDVAVTIAGISVADVDVAEGTGRVRVTLSVGSGTLTVPTGVAGGLTAAQVTGNGTGRVVLEGPIAAVNATLAAGVTYLGRVNFGGTDSLEVVVNDLGNTGAGGPLEATATVSIRVVSAADQIAELRARVVALGARGALNGGQTNSLLVKLDQAAQKLADGQVKVAYNLIGAFVDEVESLRAGGVLPPDQADWLLVPARRVRQSLLVGGGF
jgi:hypothetical protein